MQVLIKYTIYPPTYFVWYLALAAIFCSLFWCGVPGAVDLQTGLLPGSRVSVCVCVIIHRRRRSAPRLPRQKYNNIYHSLSLLTQQQ